MHIDISELNKKIEIIEEVNMTDSEGFEKTKEKIICKPYAKIKNITGTKELKSGKEYLKGKTRFLIRYRKNDFNKNMKIKYKNKFYEIEFINNLNEANKYIEFIAEVK